MEEGLEEVMDEEVKLYNFKLYTFSEVLERLMLTDEEVLLCKQHREYNDRLDDMLNDGNETR
jgi:hypothetical protein